MPIDRKRRIFRPGPLAPPRRTLPVRPTLVLGVAAVLLVAGVALLSRPATLFGRVPVAAGTVQAGPEAVAVVDGGTLRLDSRVLRLRGVAAPVRGRPCHGADGRPFDCGGAAAEQLAGLVRDRAVTCRLVGHDAAGRAEAICTAGGTELNRAIVAAGFARAAPGEPALDAAEAEARAARRGLWAGAAF